MSKDYFASIAGHEHVKRALEVGAVKNKNILLSGPLGAGKSTLALAYNELIEGSMFRISVTTTPDTVNKTLLDCDGQEGLIMVEHLPTIKREVLLCIERLIIDNGTAMIATMQPCPCGYLRDVRRQCLCTSSQIKQHLSIVSSMLEIFDIYVEVPPLTSREIMRSISGLDNYENTETIKERVLKAQDCGYKDMKLDKQSLSLMEVAIDKLFLSLETVNRIIGVSRLIANLDDVKNIEAHHIAEAIQYRAFSDIR